MLAYGVREFFFPYTITNKGNMTNFNYNITNKYDENLTQEKEMWEKYL